MHKNLRPQFQVNKPELEKELHAYPNKKLGRHLLQSLTYGIDLGVEVKPRTTRECEKNFSVRNEPKIVSELLVIHQEISTGYLLGPMDESHFPST